MQRMVELCATDTSSEVHSVVLKHVDRWIKRIGDRGSPSNRHLVPSSIYLFVLALISTLRRGDHPYVGVTKVPRAPFAPHQHPECGAELGYLFSLTKVQRKNCFKVVDTD